MDLVVGVLGVVIIWWLLGVTMKTSVEMRTHIAALLNEIVQIKAEIATLQRRLQARREQLREGLIFQQKRLITNKTRPRGAILKEKLR